MDMLNMSSSNDNITNELKEYSSWQKEQAKKNGDTFVSTLTNLQEKNIVILEKVKTSLELLTENKSKLDKEHYKKQLKLSNKYQKSTEKLHDSLSGINELENIFNNYTKNISKEIKTYRNDEMFSKMNKTLHQLADAKRANPQIQFNDKAMSQLQTAMKGSNAQMQKQFDEMMKQKPKELKKKITDEKKSALEGKKKSSWLFNFDEKLQGALTKGLSKVGSKSIEGIEKVGQMKPLKAVGGIMDKFAPTRFIKGGITNALDVGKTSAEIAGEDVKEKEEGYKEKAESTGQKDAEAAAAKFQAESTKIKEQQNTLRNANNAFKRLMKDKPEVGTGEEGIKAFNDKLMKITATIAKSESDIKNTFDNMNDVSGDTIRNEIENEKLHTEGYDNDTSELDKFTKAVHDSTSDKIDKVTGNQQHLETDISTLLDTINTDGISTLDQDNIDGLDTKYVDKYLNDITSQLETIIIKIEDITQVTPDITQVTPEVVTPDITPVTPEVVTPESNIIPGNDTQGDKVPALVNSGEMVLNQEQQANLFNMIGAPHFEDGGVVGIGPIKSEEQLDSLIGYEDSYTEAYQNNQQQRMNSDQQIFDFKTTLQQTELQNQEQTNQKQASMSNKMTMLEKASAIKEKSIMVGQAIATTAQSVGKAFAMGQVDPFAINATIQAVIAGAMGAAQIASIAGVGFEDGGIVPGDDYEGDRVIARVNSGEMILNAEQQENILGAINNAPQFAGGGVAGSVSTGQSDIMNIANKGKETMTQSTDALDKISKMSEATVKELKNVINTIKENKPTLVTRMPGKQFPSVRFNLDYSNY